MRFSHEDKTLRSIYHKFGVKNPHEMITASKLMVEGLKQPLMDFVKLPWKRLIAKYDKYSMKSWLIEKANISEASVDVASIFYNIEPWLDTGLVRT